VFPALVIEPCRRRSPQLSGGIEAREVAEFGQRGDRHGQWHPTQGLEGCDDRLQPPGCDLLVAFLLQTLETFGVFVDGADVFLEDNVLSRGGTDHLAEPSEGGRAPGSPARVPDVRPEQEGFQTKLGRFEITDGVFTRAGEVADRFIVYLGDIDGGQITRAHQPRQLHGVAAVGFHPLARLFRNQGGGGDPAAMAFVRQIAREPVATRSRFIDNDEVWGLGWPFADEVVDVDVSRPDGAEVDDLSVGLFGDIGHRKGIFVDIQTDIECARVTHG
jgi:hypothetical protein